MPKRSIGFRSATLVDASGRIAAYADRLAIGSYTIGLSSVTFAPLALSKLLGGRMPQVTVLEAGRPRLRLTGLNLSLPSGERRLPDGGWACDAAIGTFQRVTVMRNRRTPRR